MTTEAFGPPSYEDVTIDGQPHKAQIVKDIAVKPGEDSVFNRQWGGSRAEPIVISATGQAINGACVVYGFKATAGTTPTLALYDGTSASGTPVELNRGTLTVGAPYEVAGVTGVYCASGLYATVGGTGGVSITLFVVRQ